MPTRGSAAAFKPTKGMLIFVGSAAGLCIIELVGYPRGQRPDKQTEALALLLLCLFFQFLSAYPRAHSVDETPDLSLRVTPDRQTPGS